MNYVWRVANILGNKMLICFSQVWLFAVLWTLAHQVPLSMGFSRQEYRSGLPCPSPRDLPNPGIKFAPLKSPALTGGFFTTSATWEAQNWQYLETEKVKSSSCWKVVDAVNIHGVKGEDNNLTVDILSLRHLQALCLNLRKMSGLQIQFCEILISNLNVPKSSSLLVVPLPLTFK